MGNQTENQHDFGQLRAVSPPERLADQLRRLLAISDFNTSGRERSQLRQLFASANKTCQEVTSAAFDWEADAALDDAHRSLYSIYADRVWLAPHEARPLWAETAFSRIRNDLETGFRHWLARRRNFQPVAKPREGADLEHFFESLACGEVEHDSGRWEPFIREMITLSQLQEVVAQRSLFFLREPDPWVYAIPMLSGTAKAGLIDLLLDEYGWGKLERMHSSVYAALLDALDLEFATDHFEPDASWQYLATLNHQWMCALTPEHRRRLLGVIYLTEATSPHAMSNYLAAWERLGIDDPRVTEFYELHVTADENHRDVALREVLIPVCERDPEAIEEISLGIADARLLEAQFAEHLIARFSTGESSLATRPPRAAVDGDLEATA